MNKKITWLSIAVIKDDWRAHQMRSLETAAPWPTIPVFIEKGSASHGDNDKIQLTLIRSRPFTRRD